MKMNVKGKDVVIEKVQVRNEGEEEKEMKGLNIDIDEGERVEVVGKRGDGK